MNSKQHFLNQEIRMLSFNAAFQRAAVFIPDISSRNKGYMRNMLHGRMTSMLDQYKTDEPPVGDDQHIENLISLQMISENFGEQFKEGRLRLGVIQKLFNLFLKYHWCLGTIDTPPHFPVDRIIQETLQIEPRVNWTQLSSLDEYLRIIDFAKTYLEDKSNFDCENCNSIAELELKLFKRRNWTYG